MFSVCNWPMSSEERKQKKKKIFVFYFKTLRMRRAQGMCVTSYWILLMSVSELVLQPTPTC